MSYRDLPHIQILKRASQKPPFETVYEARGTLARLRGLLFESQIPDGHALWISNCNSVHTFGMTYPIYVAFLNRDLRIIKLFEGLKPNRISPVVWGAKSVLEFIRPKSGVLPIQEGEELYVVS